MPAMPAPTRILVIDESADVRRDIAGWLGHPKEFLIVGTVINPKVAAEKITRLRPDVILAHLDFANPENFRFIGRFSEKAPVPVILNHPHATDGSTLAIAALRAGAFDVFARPETGPPAPELIEQLRRKVREARRFAPTWPGEGAQASAIPRLSREVILIGASTGGTEAVLEVLRHLPGDLPGVCIVQHIPAVFSRSFAQRLNEQSALEVREAAEGDLVETGVALVAPGGYHLVLERHPGGYRVHLHVGEQVHHQRPSVDELFFSAVKTAGSHALAVVLTGMGRDGALGLKQLREAGARTLAQDEATSVVYGMPKEAARLDAVDKVLPLTAIAPEIVAWARRKRSAEIPASAAAS